MDHPLTTIFPEDQEKKWDRRNLTDVQSGGVPIFSTCTAALLGRCIQGAVDSSPYPMNCSADAFRAVKLRSFSKEFTRMMTRVAWHASKGGIAGGNGP